MSDGAWDGVCWGLFVLMAGLLLIGPEQLLAGPGGQLLGQAVSGGRELLHQVLAPLFGSLSVLGNIPAMLSAL